MPTLEQQAGEYYNRGNALLKKQHYIEAIEAYTLALRLAPRFGAAYYNRALARFYQGYPEEGLSDLRNAAVAGFNLEFFPVTWFRYLREYGGYRRGISVYNDLEIPFFLRDSLRTILEEELQEESFLLREWPESGIQFSPDSLQLRCAIGDLIRNRFELDISTAEEVVTLSLKEKNSRPEVAWRLHYLSGLLYGSTFLETLEGDGDSIGLFFDDDFMGDHALFVDQASDLGRALDSLLLHHHPEWNELTVTQRFAHFALREFKKAARKLCAARRLHLPPPKAAPLHWAISQDLWRTYLETTALLRDFHATTQAIAFARYFNALVGLKGWFDHAPPDPEQQAERLGNFFYPPKRIEKISREEVLLDYFIFEKATDMVVFGVQTGDHQEVSKTQIPSDSVVELVEISRQWDTGTAGAHQMQMLTSAYRGIDLQPSSRNQAAVRLQTLNRLLIDPVRETIGQCSRLLIAPFGYLYNIPFHLLPGIRELIDRGTLREIVYTPGVPFVSGIRQRMPADRRHVHYLFVGGGDTISYQQELKAVRQLFPKVHTLTGKAATRKAVVKAICKADVVHFACHGGFDHDRNCAFLQLPQDRLYPGHLLEAKDMSPDLVLLNACVSGVFYREARNGDAAIGLPSAFLLAGARQVIGSLWPIDDKAAVAFATSFFNRWQAEPGLSTAATVLEVQRSMREDPDFREVSYWGAHAIFGDWR